MLNIRRENWTGREDLPDEAFANEMRKEMLLEAIAESLEELAQEIRSGKILEDMRPRTDEHMRCAYTYPSSFRDLYDDVFIRTRDMLKEIRDIGSLSDLRRRLKYLRSDSCSVIVDWDVVGSTTSEIVLEFRGDPDEDQQAYRAWDDACSLFANLFGRLVDED